VGWCVRVGCIVGAVGRVVGCTVGADGRDVGCTVGADGRDVGCSDGRCEMVGLLLGCAVGTGVFTYAQLPPASMRPWYSAYAAGRDARKAHRAAPSAARTLSA